MMTITSVSMVHNNRSPARISAASHTREGRIDDRKLLSRLNIDPYIACYRRHGRPGLAAAGARLRRGGRGLRHHRGDRAAVLPARRASGARRRRWPERATGGCTSWCCCRTFVLFPVLGLAARAAWPGLLTPPLWTGLILLCVLPSTVQSSIAFTSIARGNVPAALCAATASNLLGMVLTPLLAGLLLSAHGGFSVQGGGRHRAATAAAVRRRPARSPVDRRLGRAQQDAAWPGRPRLDPAGGLCRLQRGRDARASGTSLDADAAGRRCWWWTPLLLGAGAGD